MRTAAITIASGRHQHLLAQQAGLAGGDTQPEQYVVVAMDDDGIGALLDERADVIDIPRDQGALPLAAARNAGAAAAISGGAELLIFLDVDCIPSEPLVSRYRDVAQQQEYYGGILSGPVGYLPKGVGPRTSHWESLAQPHPARPIPPNDATLPCEDYNLFWSLSFALRVSTWQRLGGFSEQYRGYGGEDTDFAYRARAAGVPLWWVGGAWAYHQHHESQSPPVGHLDDILRNAAVFERSWGEWPMQGWLTAFADLGLAKQDSTTGVWVRT
jgi:GT2 family glycosyltransferase